MWKVLRRATQTGVLRNRPLVSLMLGHLTLDMYAGFLPVLYPLLIRQFELALGTVGLLTFAYTGTASLSQPIFGWVADRYGTRFIGVALLWTAITYATIGFARSFPVLLALAAAAGLGSGLYHPFGAVNASEVIPHSRRNTAMSVYVTGGTVGVAVGPLVGVALTGLFGLRGTAMMFLPGAAIAVWLLYEMRAVHVGGKRGAGKGHQSHGSVPLLPLTAVIAVMMARNWTVLSIQTFIPTWYRSLGYGASVYGPLATTMVLASGVGMVGCGSLADRHGKRAVVIATLALSVPATLLFAQFVGRAAFLTGALIGLLAAATGPLTLVMAQQLMAGRAGMASGLILGIGFVAGAVGVPVTGAIGDALGLQNAMRLQALIPCLALAPAWLLPGEADLQAYAGATGQIEIEVPK